MILQALACQRQASVVLKALPLLAFLPNALSLSDYEAFYDHIEEKSSGSTITHAYFSQYDSFIFDLSINSFPPADRSDFYHEEFTDELAHIISPPEYDCFYFKSEPDPGDIDSNFPILVSVRCQKPGHLAARLGCAETKVATWDDLAFKLITLGWNVKQSQQGVSNEVLVSIEGVEE
ncbi:hypothetical protein Tco_0098120 [Tanacetum coccineum]